MTGTVIAANPEAQVKAWGFAHVFTWSDQPLVFLNWFRCTAVFGRLTHKEADERATETPITPHILTKALQLIWYSKGKCPLPIQETKML